MYDSNNVHILFYLIIGIIGIFSGKISAWLVMRIPEKKEIFSKDFFEANRNGLEKNYICIVIMITIYCLLLKKYGLSWSFTKNLDLIKYIVLTPMLVSAFFIDLKHRILPNRLNLTIFEIGIIFAFVCGINNLNVSLDMVLGIATGAGIFGIISILGSLIAGKETMGLGDVKFMGAIGVFFGVSSIIQISLLAFFIGAVFSIGIIVIRNVIMKSKDQYMPFGPFLVISSILCIFLPQNEILTLFMELCEKIVSIM